MNIDSEESKSGVSPDSAETFVTKLKTFDRLDIQGLMCVPSTVDPRAAFKRMKELLLRLAGQTRGRLSMGMSGDYSIAIEEGATDVRIGTLIFGPRKGIR